MSSYSYLECLSTAQADGAALGNTLTATSILPAQAKFILPAGVLDKVGKAIRITAAGRVSNPVTTPGTLTLDVRLGAVIAANGGAMSLNVVAKTNVPWFLEWLLTLRAVGSGTSANFMHQGRWWSESVVGSPLPTAGGAGCAMLPSAAPAVGTGFDSTAAQTVDLFATWSQANAANTITLHQFAIELLN